MAVSPTEKCWRFWARSPAPPARSGHERERQRAGSGAPPPRPARWHVSGPVHIRAGRGGCARPGRRVRWAGRRPFRDCGRRVVPGGGDRADGQRLHELQRMPPPGPLVRVWDQGKPLPQTAALRAIGGERAPARPGAGTVIREDRGAGTVPSGDVSQLALNHHRLSATGAGEVAIAPVIGWCTADMTDEQPAADGGTGWAGFSEPQQGRERGTVADGRCSAMVNAELADTSCSTGEVGVAQFYLPAADEECAEVDDQ